MLISMFCRLSIAAGNGHCQQCENQHSLHAECVHVRSLCSLVYRLCDSRVQCMKQPMQMRSLYRVIVVSWTQVSSAMESLESSSSNFNTFGHHFRGVECQGNLWHVNGTHNCLHNCQLKVERIKQTTLFTKLGTLGMYILTTKLHMPLDDCLFTVCTCSSHVFSASM